MNVKGACLGSVHSHELWPQIPAACSALTCLVEMRGPGEPTSLPGALLVESQAVKLFLRQESRGFEWELCRAWIRLYQFTAVPPMAGKPVLFRALGVFGG